MHACSISFVIMRLLLSDERPQCFRILRLYNESNRPPLLRDGFVRFGSKADIRPIHYSITSSVQGDQ